MFSMNRAVAMMRAVRTAGRMGRPARASVAPSGKRGKAREARRGRGGAHNRVIRPARRSIAGNCGARARGSKLARRRRLSARPREALGRGRMRDYETATRDFSLASLERQVLQKAASPMASTRLLSNAATAGQGTGASRWIGSPAIFQEREVIFPRTPAEFPPASPTYSRARGVGRGDVVAALLPASLNC